MPHRQINLESLPSFEIEVHAEGDQYIAAEIIANGVWEPFETEVIRRCLTDESEFFDIGANIGWYSVVAGLQLAGTGGAVHAFEPARENVLLLTRNVMSAGLSNVRINPCALGVAVEPITLHLSSTNKGDHRAYACEVGRSTEKSCMSRFDQYYTSTWRRPFVKIDTQGFELSVIEGMGDLLSSAEGMAMLIEFWPHGLNQEVDNVSRLISLLSNSRFQPYTVIEGDPFVRKTTWDRLTSAARTTLAPKTGCFVNLLVAREGDPMLARLSDLLHNDASPWVPEG